MAIDTVKEAEEFLAEAKKRGLICCTLDPETREVSCEVTEDEYVTIKAKGGLPTKVVFDVVSVVRPAAAAEPQPETARAATAGKKE